MPIDHDLIASLMPEVTACRHALHQQPQTAFEEVFAADLVARKLTEWEIPFVRGVGGGTGIVATVTGQKTTSGRAIGLRADLDALDIHECSGQPWTSQIPGKMHGCGHDGHTAMLLGAARYLQETRAFDGAVQLVFQPAEEGQGGAEGMIADGLFERFPMDAIYGMHNWPWLPVGTMALRSGPLLAAADVVWITVHGTGGHAAMPHRCVDPMPVAAQILLALQTIVSRNVDPLDSAVISITNFNGGTGAHNVVPDQVTMMGSIRVFTPETRDLLERRMGEVALGIASAAGCTVEYVYERRTAPTVNWPEPAALCTEVARRVFGEDRVEDSCLPFMTAEDFGAFLQHRPGCFVLLGQGVRNPSGDTSSPHSRGLHSPHYDFNDLASPLGIAYWAELVETALPLRG